MDHRREIRRMVCGQFVNFARLMSAVKRLQLAGALEHAAKNFALLYAGAGLAIEAKILPWSLKKTLTDLVDCFERAVAEIHRSADTLADARQRLQSHLNSSQVVQYQKGKKFGPKEYAGYAEERDGSVRYTIHAKAFRSWFPNRAQCSALLKWLHARGALALGGTAGPPSLKSTQWAERDPRWPDGTAQKSFVFTDPFTGRKPVRHG